jgi:F-type H+-transporting ATPase subunit gamma
MPSTRDIRRRIKSVKSTQQITKAMQMVASAKMRRAQQSALASRPYARLMYRMQRDAITHAGDFSHPLLETRTAHQRAVLLLSTDKGMCGALNSNLFREAMQFDRRSTLFLAAGRKAAQFIARTKRDLAGEFTFSDNPKFSQARAMAKMAIDLFLSRKVDRVEILFNRFISTLVQKPVSIQFLPVSEIKGLVLSPEEQAMPQKMEQTPEFLFEPSAGHVLGELLPSYLNLYVYQMLLEAKASEQSARMVAMKNATDNAKQIIKDLTLEYNKMRQTSITNELLEISTAQMALG